MLRNRASRRKSSNNGQTIEPPNSRDVRSSNCAYRGKQLFHVVNTRLDSFPMPVDASTIHLLVEYNGCDVELLDDIARMETMLRQAAIAAKATVVAATFHRFSPQGITGVVILEESHLSIHTWPEVGYAALDFFTCGECVPERAHEFVRRQLQATRVEVMTIHRGLSLPEPSMKIVSHRQEN